MGINNPDCAIIIINPSVLSVTVFPPVFGPVIITVSHHHQIQSYLQQQFLYLTMDERQ